MGIQDYDIFEVLYDDEVSLPTQVLNEEEGSFTAREAFVLSINRFGRINLKFMSAKCGRPEDDLIRELEGVLIWKDPSRYLPKAPYEGWITREQYVQGNIFRLLSEAEEADRKTGLFSKNIELLRSELPDGPEAHELKVTLGATWVPAGYFLQFICDLLDMEAFPPTLELDTFFGKWSLKGGCSFNIVRNIAIYGTYRMPALKIIAHTMNASPIQIYDKQTDPVTGKEKSVLNKYETMAAQEKQQLIIQEFQKWLDSHPEILSCLQEIYSSRYGYQISHYNGSFLQLPGINREIHLYQHQKDAIARIVLSGENVLLSHDVGAGKTYAFAAGIHERLRMGLSKKAMLVVPNSVFDTTVEAIRRLYPDEKMTPISVKQFGPSKRDEVLRQIKDAGSGYFILAASSFDMIGMSKQFHLERKVQEILKCKRELDCASDHSKKSRMITLYRRLLKEHEKIRDREEKPVGAYFDQMDIDLLVLDECHNYKNISLSGNMDPIVGMHMKGSKKADLMLEKCDFVREGGGKLIFATGTPLTNSMADLYVLQRYLQPEELRILDIFQFNEWVNTFCTKHTEFEIDPSASSFRFVTRFDHFHNLPELMALFGNVCDFYKIDPASLDLPEFNGYQNITVPKSEGQKEYIKSIVERIEDIRKHRVDRKVDNYLKVTTDGRKCALDLRLVDPENYNPETDALTKAEAAASTVKKIYDSYPGQTQALFCDISIPGKGFNLYDEVKRLLICKGIPEDEIAFIHEGSTDSKREKILKDFNKGVIRVLLGSTPKLGLGVNIQERLIAVHHLDAPWKPADMIQREGRAIRQGNMNSHVLIFRYVTESSFDAYTWQILENKQRFLASFLSGNLDRSHRSEQDIGDMVLSYSEIKALAIGNPLIKSRVEVSNRISRVRTSAARRHTELQQYQKMIMKAPEECEALRKQISAVSADVRKEKNHRKAYSKLKKEEIGRKILSAIRKHEDRDYQLLWYHGFKVIIPARQDSSHPFILLQNSPEISYRVELKNAKMSGCCTRMDHVLQNLSEKSIELTDRINGIQNTALDAQAELRKGNPFQDELKELSDQLQDIDRKLKEEFENENKH